jgi:hypothetical protein
MSRSLKPVDTGILPAIIFFPDHDGRETACSWMVKARKTVSAEASKYLMFNGTKESGLCVLHELERES